VSISKSDIFKVYIGYDKSEDEAYQVCRSSLVRHSSIPLYIQKLNYYDLSWPGSDGIFTRKWYMKDGQSYDIIDKRPFSTEFSFTRFLVPILDQYNGWSLFLDCDFLWRADISDLLDFISDEYAVMCVKHEHIPVEFQKMQGVEQSKYSRKNWSSFVLWNSGHPSNRKLTRNDVNTREGRWLHNFGWLDDNEIGELPEEWNWLEGYSDLGINPKCVHFTRGGPWWTKYSDCLYSDEWRKAKNV